MSTAPATVESPDPAASTGAELPSPPSTSTTSALPGSGPAEFLARWGVLVVAVIALISSFWLWQKLSGIQEQLARQSADSSQVAIEARGMAKQAQDSARETAARLAVTETKLSEVSLQRSQLEELMQSLSRSRDENLVVDIESAIRLAQQQAQLTGSVEPVLAALKSADQRVSRAAQPRLTPLQRAIARDIDRVKAATVADTPGLLVKLDELVRLADELPVANAVNSSSPAVPSKAASGPVAPSDAWWRKGLNLVLDEARGLVRVSRIEQPEAALLSPEQSFFLRENLKLKLLNARLGLLARQMDSVRSDLAAANLSMNRYFDPTSRKTQAALSSLSQVQAQLKVAEMPRLDNTLAALATAAAGR